MRRAGVVKTEDSDQPKNQKGYRSFIAKWKKYAENVRDFSGFRKATRLMGPLPPSADPRRAAKVLSVMAKKLALKYRSANLRKLATELEQASRDVRTARNILTRLQTSSGDNRPVLERRPKPETVARSLDRQAAFDLPKITQDYLLSQIRRNNLSKQELTDLMNDAHSIKTFETYLTNKGLRVNPAAIQQLWSDGLNSIASSNQQAKKLAIAKHFYGADDVDTGYVDGCDNTFSRYIPASTELDSPKGLTRKTAMEIIGEVIEAYASTKNPSKITPEDLFNFLREHFPQHGKDFKSLWKVLFKLTHRPTRHELDNDDDGDDEAEDETSEDNTVDVEAMSSESVDIESKVVPLAKWLMENIDGLSTARALTWSKRLLPWVDSDQIIPGDLTAKTISDQLQISVEELQHQLRSVIEPMSVEPEDAERLTTQTASVLRQFGHRFPSPEKGRKLAAHLSQRLACGGFSERVEVVRQIISKDGRSVTQIKASVTPETARQLWALLQDHGDDEPAEVIRAARADRNPILDSNMEALDPLPVASLPAPEGSGFIELAGARVGPEPPAGMRFGEDHPGYHAQV